MTIVKVFQKCIICSYQYTKMKIVQILNEWVEKQNASAYYSFIRYYHGAQNDFYFQIGENVHGIQHVYLTRMCCRLKVLYHLQC